MKPAIKVAVTGAAGQIGYSLLFRIASGEMFGKDQPVVLQLLELPIDKVQQALRGVVMELEDCAFPLLQGVVPTQDPKVAFRGASWYLLVGSKPRGPGMERADLLKDNGRIFVEHGRIIDELAADDARVVVVGNPCNTNCMIAAAQARRLPPERFTAMTRLDQNRAVTQLAQKAKVPVTSVTDLVIYGNHSPTMFADFLHAKIDGRLVPEVIRDEAWLTGTFLPAVGKRGAVIIEARGASSAASAANALIDHVRALLAPGPNVHSAAVKSDGSYGFAEGVWASVPVRTTGSGTCEVVKGIEHDAFARQRLKATNEELLSERETVKEFLKG